MLDRLRPRLTYANVTATLALFLVLGGAGSYAALHLGRNSVGPAQIRTGAVGTRELRNHSILMLDINPQTRAALKARGTQGPPGPGGATYWELVSSTGEHVRGNGNGGEWTAHTGHYTIGFSPPAPPFPPVTPPDPATCAFGAVIASTDGTQPPAGYATTWYANGFVNVATYNASGNPTDMPFLVFGDCPYAASRR